jgi:mRNA interferase RelE/StbE
MGYPYHRVDIGECRIIDNVDRDVLKVFLIGKRKDDEIYRTLRRRR